MGVMGTLITAIFSMIIEKATSKKGQLSYRKTPVDKCTVYGNLSANSHITTIKKNCASIYSITTVQPLLDQ